MANMVFMPVADKLKLRRIEEEKLNAICVDGVNGILNGQNSRTLESTLNIYLVQDGSNSGTVAEKAQVAKLEQAA